MTRGNKALIGMALSASVFVAGVLGGVGDAQTIDDSRVDVDIKKDIVPLADHDLDYGDFRLAIADQACKVEGEAGWNYQQQKCVYTISRAGHCGCFTHDSETLTGELSEAEIETLKATHPNWFIDMGVCSGTLEAVPQRWVQYAPYYCDDDADCPGTATCNLGVNRCIPDPAWTCVLIKRGVPKVLTNHSATKNAITLAVIEKCCDGCDPGKCWIRPTRWGAAPFCLLDANCATYCLD